VPTSLHSASGRCFLSALALALAAAPSAALAVAPDGLTRDQLAQRTRLLTEYGRLVDPSSADIAPADLPAGPSCLTGLVRDLRANPDLFSPDEWLDITSTLGFPATRSVPPTLPPRADAPPTPTESDGTCVGNTGTNSLIGEHFVVYWDSATETQAQNLLDSLEYSWTREIDELGWQAPDGTGRYKLRFQISNANYAGAYTTVGYCNSSVGYMPYFVAGRGSFSAGNWYKSMASHEFNHSSQFGYGYAHEFYWWEATATYMEEYVYPDYNDWADFYVYFSYYPFLSLNASDQSDNQIFGHMYGMGIWATYLDEYVGGHDLVMGTWDQAQGRSGQYNYWMPDVIEDMGYNFDELWQGFMATSAYMDFSEYSSYYDIQSLEESGALPAEGSEPGDAPWSLGLNFVSFDASQGASGKYLQVDFAGDSAVDWNVVLVTGSGHTVTEYVAADVQDGAGTAWIPFDGSDSGYLVVSPKDPDVSGFNYNWGNPDEYSYTWSACLTDSETGLLCGADASMDTGGASDGPATPADTTTKGGCGCASTVAPMTGMVWGLGLLGLVGLRRRRSFATLTD